MYVLGKIIEGKSQMNNLLSIRFCMQAQGRELVYVWSVSNNRERIAVLFLYAFLRKLYSTQH